MRVTTLVGQESVMQKCKMEPKSGAGVLRFKGVVVRTPHDQYGREAVVLRSDLEAQRFQRIDEDIPSSGMNPLDFLVAKEAAGLVSMSSSRRGQELDRYAKMALKMGVTEGFDPEEVNAYWTQVQKDAAVVEEGLEKLLEADRVFDKERLSWKRRVAKTVDLYVACGCRRDALLRKGLRELHGGRDDESHVSEPTRKRRKHDARHERGAMRTVDQTARLAGLERQAVPVELPELPKLTEDEVEYQEWYEAEAKKRTTEYFVALKHLATAEEVVAEKAAGLESLGVQVPIRGSHGSLENVAAAKAKILAATPEDLALPERLAQ